MSVQTSYMGGRWHQNWAHRAWILFVTVRWSRNWSLSEITIPITHTHPIQHFGTSVKNCLQTGVMSHGTSNFKPHYMPKTYTRCTMRYALCILHYKLCIFTVLYIYDALFSTLHIQCTIQWIFTIHNALCTFHIVLFTICYAQSFFALWLRIIHFELRMFILY